MEILPRIRKWFLKEFRRKKISIVLLVLAVYTPQLWAQQYLTLGVGYSTAFLGSDELNLFKETYNAVYYPLLREGMRGFGASVGLQWEIGYRRMGRLATAFLFGAQNHSGQDIAQFYNGDSRRLKIDIQSYYIECEMGRTFKNIYVNGLLTLFFKREITLYSVASQLQPKEALGGTYEGITSVSTDLGVAIGYFKDPIFLTCKITYPLFTGGGSTALRDNSPEKFRERTYFFPDDYEAYLSGGFFHGVKCNIDGLKILVMAAFAIKIKK